MNIKIGAKAQKKIKEQMKDIEQTYLRIFVKGFG